MFRDYTKGRVWYEDSKQDFLLVVNNWRKSAVDKVRYVFAPRVHCRALQERLDELLRQESEAGKIGLQLYAENESLRRYKEISDGHKFCPWDDYSALKKERDMYREKAQRVSMALDDMLAEWNKSIKANPFKIESDWKKIGEEKGWKYP